MTPVSNNMTSSFGTALRNGLLTNTIRRRSGFCGSDRIAICCRRLKFQSCRKTLVCNYVGRDGGVVFLALGDVSGRPSEGGGIAPSAARPFPVTTFTSLTYRSSLVHAVEETGSVTRSTFGFPVLRLRFSLPMSLFLT